MGDVLKSTLHFMVIQMWMRMRKLKFTLEKYGRMMMIFVNGSIIIPAETQRGFWDIAPQSDPKFRVLPRKWKTQLQMLYTAIDTDIKVPFSLSPINAV